MYFRSLLLLFLSVFTSIAAQEDVLIQNVNIVDVEVGAAQLGSVFIQKGRIEGVGALKIPTENIRVIDGNGKWLIPGLVDAHMHLFQSGGLYTRPDVIDLTAYRDYATETEWVRENARDILKRYLRMGITTVIDLGGPLANYAIRNGLQDSIGYPNLLLTGPLLSTYQPAAFSTLVDPPIQLMTTPEEAVAFVRQQLRYRPDFIKIWYIDLPTLPADSTFTLVKAAIDESHLERLKVAVHATQLNTAKLAVKAGADFLVHSVDEPIDLEFIELLRENNVALIPTLMVHGQYIEAFTQQHRFTAADLQYSNPIPLGHLLDPAHFEADHPLTPYAESSDAMQTRLQQQDRIRAQNLKRLYQAGIPIATGTDAGNIGTLHASSYLEELARMKAAGASSAQILRSATIDAARILGLDMRYGTITANKLADLVLLTANPLEDAEALSAVDLVIKDGYVYDVDTLIPDSPEHLAQRQLNAYNLGDIDAFLAPYADSVAVYNFPDQLRYTGKERMRAGYASFFERNPNLHCELVNRIVDGNTVIDHERITGIEGSGPFTAIAIYKIEAGKIARVYFVR